RVVVQGDGASISREVIGAQPILPQHDGVSRKSPDVFDETREMKRYLRIGRLIERACLSNRLCLPQMVNFNDPGRDAALRRLKDEACGEACRQQQAAECHQSPVSGLDARRSDTVVPDLRCLLVGRHWLRCTAIMDGRSFEHRYPPSERSTEAPPPALSPLRT